MAIEDREKLQERQRLEAFVKRTLGRFMLGGLVIPILFVGLTVTHTRVMPLWIADALAWPLSYVWPVLYGNFVAIKAAGYVMHAANLILFATIMILFVMALGIYGLIMYIRYVNAIQFPPLSVQLGSFALMFAYYIGLSNFRKVRFHFESPSQFYLDRFGFFYFGEYIGFLCLALSLYFIVIGLAQLFYHETQD